LAPNLADAQDITLQELRIESFFPMDSETRDAFRKWAAPSKNGTISYVTR
jgi:hypothetical protein